MSRRLSGACWLVLALTVGCGGPEPQAEAPVGLAVSAPARPVPHPLPLAPGAAFEASLRPGEAHLYRLDLPVGQFADLVIDQRGIDVNVRLAGRSPSPVVDSPNEAWGPEPLPVLGAADGPLLVEVRTPDGNGPPGRYAVLLQAVRPATEGDRALVAAERDFAAAEGLRRQGDGDSLRRAAARAEQIAARLHGLGETERMADAFYAAGRSRWRLGEAEAAQRDFAAALPVFRAANDRRAVGRALNSLGPIYLALENPAAAAACYRESLPIFRATGDLRGEATALLNLGRAQATLGKVKEALTAYDQSLALARRLGRRDLEGATLANRGDLFKDLGQTEQAFADFDQALLLLEGRPEAAGALAGRGYLNLQAGRKAEAGTDLRQALAMHRRAGDRRNEAVTLNSLGLLYESEGKAAEARQAFGQALAAFASLEDHPNEAAVLANLGHLEAGLGDAAAAEAAFRRALPAFATAGRRASEGSAWIGLAQALRAQGDPQEALQAAERGLARIEDLRQEPESHELRTSFFASQQEAYALAVDLAMDLGDGARALETNERARARSLLDALAEAQIQPASLRRPLKLGEIQSRVLDRDAQMLEFALGERRSFLWMVSAGRLESWVLPPRSVLEGAARRAHTALAQPNRTLARTETGAALADLSRLLLAPAAGRLTSSRLLVVPDGALHLVPFAALPDPAAGDGSPLLARRQVVTAPSASSLAALRHEADARPPAPAVVAVLADPVFDREDSRVPGGRNGATATLRGPAGRFARLPYTREEAESVLALAPPGERLAAIGFAARRELALDGALARFRVLHFATHAVVDPEHPELSGIALSMVDEAGRPRDGFLRSLEIYRLHLRADLVVLSACETALGREVRGEGVVGLTRAFLHGGARRLLVSLWPVEDLATAELMRRFYQGLFGERLSPAEALRQAQDGLRRQPGRGDPYFWAGFVLQGDPR